MKSSKSIEDIAIVCNLKKPGFDDDRYEEYDEVETIQALSDEIRKYGFDVSVIEQDSDFFANITKASPDLVFNIAEGIGNSRCRESQVPCILDSLGIRYTGSDALSLAVSLDKYLTNSMLDHMGIPVPKMYMVNEAGHMDGIEKKIKGKGYFLLKPRWEGSSKGIFQDCLLNEFDAIKAKVRRIIDDYGQPVVIEEFLEGDEITAAVIGNEKPRFLGLMKIEPAISVKGGRFVYSIEVKRDWKKTVRYEGQKKVAGKVRKQVEKNALAVFKALELRDVARIDFRLDKDGMPKVIDVNPLPGLSPHYSDLPIMCRLNGEKYSNLIKDILAAAFKRYESPFPKAKGKVQNV